MQRLTCGIGLLAALAGSLGAQSADSSRYSVTPYFWMAGVQGDVGVGPVAVHIHQSFNDVLESLKFGAMISGEARVSRYVFGLDAMYLSLGDEKTVAFRGDTGSFSLGEHETMIQPSAGMSFGGRTWGIDGLVSLRYWNLNAKLDVASTLRPPNEHSRTRQWVDGLLAARAHWTPMNRVHFTAYGDGGAGGSHDTWQAYGAVTGDLYSWLSLDFAYRALWVNYDRDNFLFDTRTAGPVIAVSFRF